jgi:hypothetical protein
VSKIEPPWTPVQVSALNSWQRRGSVHPFTCGNRDAPGHEAYARQLGQGDHGILIAEKTGWRCPVCGYRQYWAHDFMVETP